MKKVLPATLALASTFAVVAGCFGDQSGGSIDAGGSADVADERAMSDASADGASSEESVVNTTPDDTLFFYTVDLFLTKRYVQQEDFEKYIGQFIRKKFPNIKIKHVLWDDGTRYEDLIAKGTIPDIIFEDTRRNAYRYVRRFGLEYDMTDLIKKYNFDTGALDPSYLQLSLNSSDGKLYSLPFEGYDYMLYYNKDIFDKFGVEYPKAGMTYDEAYELAKHMTRQEGDITYKGYQQHPEYYMMLNQLAEPALDPNEDKASMLSDNWVKIVDNLRRFYDIPGNQFTTVRDFPNGRMAMAVDVESWIYNYSREYPDLNFDVAPVPVFPEASNAKYQPYAGGLYISKQSNKKDLAFQVIAYLLSEEVQIERAKLGIRSPLMSSAVQEAYGQLVPGLRDKDRDALFALKNAAPLPRRPGLTFIDPKVGEVFNPLIFEESKDSSAALRIVNEKMDKAIDETKAIESEGGVSPHL